MTNLDQRVFVAGHRGMVGAALARELDRRGYRNVITRGRQELDLENQNQVHRFFHHAGGRGVPGGRQGRRHPGQPEPPGGFPVPEPDDPEQRHPRRLRGRRAQVVPGFLVHLSARGAAAAARGRAADGPLESTNEPYAIAKIAGLKLCEAYQRQHGARFICAMPTNLYGRATTTTCTAAMLPALIRKFHEGREAGQASVTIWAPARRCASSFTSTTWRAPASC